MNPESTRFPHQDDRPLGSVFWYALLLPLSLLYFLCASQIADRTSTPGPVPVDGMVTFFFMAVAWPFLAAFLLLIIKGVMNIPTWKLAIAMWFASFAVPIIALSLVNVQ